MKTESTNTYFSQAAAGPVKIGLSLFPEQRLRELQTACPYELRLLATLRGDREAELHQRFAGLRMTGEWFRWDPAIDEYLQQTPDVHRTEREPFPQKLRSTQNLVEEFHCPTAVDREDLYELLEEIGPGRDAEPCQCDDEDGQALEECECECHAWQRAIMDLDACDVIERAGVNVESQWIFLRCKPLNSGHRLYQAEHVLPEIAADCEWIGWGLFGWVCGPGIPAHVVNFAWLRHCPGLLYEAGEPLPEGEFAARRKKVAGSGVSLTRPVTVKYTLNKLFTCDCQG